MAETTRRRLTRPEQQEITRAHLLDAAERLFGEHGIGETSIEQISEAAGYSRGAFYSNFSDKDAIVFALLDRHEQRNLLELHVLQDGTTPDEFLEELTARERQRSGTDAVVFMEYVLYATRSAAGRERLRAVNADILRGTEEMVDRQFADRDIAQPISSAQAAKIMLALDEGFSLLRLIDPEGFPHGIWGETVAFLSDATEALMAQRPADT